MYFKIISVQAANTGQSETQGNCEHWIRYKDKQWY